MKEPRIRGKKSKGRSPDLAKKPINTKLYSDDYITVGKLTASWGKSDSEVLRIIVADWLRSNRVRAMGRDEAAEEVRGVYERVVSEQVAPLARDLAEIKRALAGGTQLNTAAAAPGNQAPVGRAAVAGESVAGLRALIEQAAGDLTESGSIQLEKIERLERAMAMALSLLGETFSSTWMVRDFVIRYLVEVDMAGQNKAPDDIDDAVEKEKLVLVREASNSIGLLEAAHQLPEELRITLSEFAAVSGGRGAAGDGATA
jgi:hypothetical protein